MIDSIVDFYKHLPHLWHHAIHRVKHEWKWFILPVLISAILLIALMVSFHVKGTPDLNQARWYYRLSAFTSFMFVWFAIYRGYKLFEEDYWYNRQLSLTPVVHNVLVAIIYSVLLGIMEIIYIVATPLNIESSVLAVLFFMLMSVIFIILSSTILGQFTLVSNKVDIIYFILSVVIFILLPIWYIPTSYDSLVTHLLMINPVFYLVDGMAQSVVLGVVSLTNIPYHLYFIFILAIGFVINYGLTRYVVYKKYEVEPRFATVSTEETKQTEATVIEEDEAHRDATTQTTDETNSDQNKN
ncbi:teichoic acid transport system permease protein [Staphylococcus auricularis]|uniref:Sugar ABC transporter permease n=1 Tax=Staphylococcus auricularis TaxID=29379 RepID=A0AAW7MA58_9STAP|nr:sugar ABC transporter permease [Staphylococcus auricularis]MBM0867016.1 sugar ABC transporter permease [Staphylococcus auricularis]MCG7342120.1 sugar ABC transporter permease [Staphylococcus auricularis]MDC6327935.1 sugar ABC transporter permease [Staphylococcus auricularis]MDN4532010.1 sugar ABC transporter permease [Staphylococcus auricularis]HJE01322.1 sugar ABC transporter permease [Staphylococcus auricularis]